MRNLPGAPGTRIGLGLRLAQAALAAAALGAMVSTGDGYSSVTAFRYFVPAVALQCMWSLAMAIVDVYAILVGRSFRTPRVVSILSVGDWITGALTFSAASAAAGITILINDDLEYCYDNPCPSFMSATAMAFLSSFVVAPCCVLNLGQIIAWFSFISPSKFIIEFPDSVVACALCPGAALALVRGGFGLSTAAADGGSSAAAAARCGDEHAGRHSASGAGRGHAGCGQASNGGLHATAVGCRPGAGCRLPTAGAVPRRGRCAVGDAAFRSGGHAAD
ncbi:hypothetical protein ACQ4PT_044083 [Festuca glaucescens]